MKYKKFILFAYEAYYPAGGLSDIEGSYDTLEEAIVSARATNRDFLEIVDRDTWEIVWENDEASDVVFG